MFEVDIHDAVVCRFAQVGRWVSPFSGLSLYVSGLRWRRDQFGLHTEFSPSLNLRPPGEPAEFEYGPDRENWVLLFSKPEILPADNPDAVLLSSAGQSVRLPRTTPVSTVQLPHLQQLFSQLVEAFHEPTALGRIRARTKFFALLDFVVDRHYGAQTPSAAAKLKLLLDADETCQRSLDAMSAECGCSPDHLRRQFFAEYGINPHAYRSRRRLAMVSRMLAETDLSVKEIAARLGFNYVSHLSLAYQRTTGRSPSQARQELRAQPRAFA